MKEKLLLLLFLCFTVQWATAQNASFTTNITANGCELATYEFTDTSTGVDASTQFYEWIFGNGNSVELAASDPAASVQAATYSGAGTYSVTLNIKDGPGAGGNILSTATEQIVVYEPADPDFVADEVFGCTSHTVTFTDLTDTSDPLVGAIEEWTWNFGDGTTISGPFSTITHTYTNPGNFQVTLTVETFAGGLQNCIASEVKADYIRVRHTPEANFTVQNLPACSLPYVAQFQSTSTVPTSPPPPGTINAYEWTFYDTDGVTVLGTSTLENPDFTYIDYGVYPVMLMVRTTDGCTDDRLILNAVRINENIADFNLPTAATCQNANLVFTDNSSAGAVGWSWNFGDGSPPATAQNPTHVYNTPGTYNVTLTTTFSDGCAVTSAPQSITINAAPNANFSISPPDVQCTVPSTLTFNPVSTGAGFTYSWNFGDPTFIDGGTSTASNPSHTYTNFGTYTVTLVITDGGGCSNTAQQTFTIDEPDPDFTISSPTRGCANFNVTFDASPSTANQAIVEYEFDFGDGSPTVIIPGPTATPQVTHTYTTFGDYIPSLTIRTAGGCERTIAQGLIEVGEPPIITDIVFNRDGCVIEGGNGITFEVVTDPTGPAVDSLVWDFGDGTEIGVGGNPAPITHTYTAIGNLNVSVVAFANGCEVAIPYSEPISIAGPIARFNVVGGNAGCTPSPTFNFNNTSIDAASGTTIYTWDFGDGSPPQQIPRGSPVSYTYAPGTYTVTLTADNTASGTPPCSNVAQTTINVSVSGADFTILPDPANVCGEQTVSFSDNSTTTGTITNWRWNLGDGTIINGNFPNVTHEYLPRETPYEVTLTITESNGCTSTSAPRTVTVNGPLPNFNATTVACEGDPVSFFDASGVVPAASNNITQWLWDFGDVGSGTANTSTLQNPTHIFSAPGTYTVTLTVTDDNTSLGRCSESVTRTIQILEKPQAGFTTTRNKYCLTNTIAFTDNSSDISTGTGLTYTWDFGDGGAGFSDLSDPSNPTHQYAAVGTYTVTLTVRSSNNCEDTFTRVLQVVDPDATISANGNNTGITVNCPPATVNFTAVPSAGADITEYLWDFGDGNVAFNVQNPNHTYLFPGIYTVTVTLRSAAGCDVVRTLNNFVTVEGPSGSFDFDPKDLCRPDVVSFEAINLSGMRFIEWDFGDGNTTGQIPLNETDYNNNGGFIANVTHVDHTYTTSGVFNPFMVLTDENGCQVAYPASSGQVRVSGPPVANFSWTNNSGGVVCENVEVDFTDLSTPDPTTGNNLLPQVNDWNWTFFDTNGTDVLGNSTDQNPTFIYPGPGIYPVQLDIQSAFGCPATITRNIEIVSPTINASFTVNSPFVICPGESVSFTNTSTFTGTPPPPISYNWEFVQDATGTVVGTSMDENPSFIFSAPGTYTVRLRVADGAGCATEDEATSQVEVFEPPAFATDPQDQEICIGENAQFSATVTANTLTTGDVEYRWQVNDGAGFIDITDNSIYAGSNSATSGVLTAGPPVRNTTTLSLTNPPLGFNGYQYRCIISNFNTTTCVDTSAVAVLTVFAQPTPAAVGPTQQLCGQTTTNLTGNVPAVGMGNWTVVSEPAGAPATITDPSNPSSSVAIGLGSYVFQWEITNGTCPPSATTLTVVNSDPANAGTDQSLCAATTFTLAGNDPATAGGGTGNWTFVSGPNVPTITSPSIFNTTVTNVVASTTPYVFRWEINSPGGCGLSSDQVTINNQPLPAFTQQPSDQTVCEGQDATFIVNAAASLSFRWQIDDGGGSGFVDLSDNATYQGTGTNTLVVQNAPFALDFVRFRVRITNTTTSCANFSNEATLRILPTPNPVLLADRNTICEGESATITIQNSQNGYTYQLREGTTVVVPVITGDGSNIDFDPVSPTTNTTYNVLVTSPAINGSSCEIQAANTITFDVVPQVTPATTAGDQTICADNATLSGNTPTVGMGMWVRTAGSGTITNPNSATTTVTGLGFGDNIFEWRITNGTCNPSTATITITRLEAPSASVAGPDQRICGTSTSLAANTPTVGTGTWSVIAGSGTFSNTNDPNTSVSNLGVGDNIFAWTITNGSCPSSSSQVTVTRDASNTLSDAGDNQTICATSTFLSANTVTNASANWVRTAGGGTIVDPADPNTEVTGLTPGINTFEWVVTNACATSISEVSIIVQENPIVANAGIDQTICAATATLAANTPTVGSGNWTVIAGAGTFANPNSPTTSVSGLSVGNNIYRWTISNGTCPPSTDEVTIIREAAPTTADAGANQNVCTANATLTANTPAIGTGQWVSLGSATVTNPASPTTTVSGLVVGSNVFEWRITNGSCPPSVASVVIVREENPTTADAGMDQTVCGNVTTLAANTPTTGTGTWTVAFGSGTFANPNNPSTTVSGLSDGDNIFTWTTSNGTCAASTDNVTITRLENPTAANAGADQTICTNSTNLTANTPTTGTGTWTVVSGSGTFAATNDPNTRVSSLAVGTNTFQWTITNGACPPSSATVAITRNPAVTTANAGPNQQICSNTTTLAGNMPINGTGTWSTAATGIFITNPNDPSTSISGLTPGTYTFTWTIESTGCSPSSDDMVIVVDAPATIANAGVDQEICDATTATLAANTAISGAGIWTITAGGAVITNPAAPGTTVTGLTPGENTFVWTITNGSCPASSDAVTIRQYPQPPTATVGADVTVCGTSSVLTGNDPSPGVGTWEVIAGSGIVTNPNSPSSGVINLSVGVNQFRWTVSNGNCPSSSAVLTITRDPDNAISDAGDNQNICANSTFLAANTPPSGTGTWVQVQGTGNIVAPNDPNTEVNTLSSGLNIFEWRVSNACATAISEVRINVSENPTVANAGPDQIVCATNTTLAANAPTVGAGAWTVVAGTGTFTNPNDPTTGVNGLSAGDNIFRWTISNGSCPSTSDLVTINRSEAPTIADAGDNQTICATTTTLLANTPTVGIGTWSTTSVGVTIDNLNDPTTSVSGLVQGNSYTFTWTISNGSCPPSSSNVVVVVEEAPTVANAGMDQTVCSANATLAGNTPIVGTGVWTTTSGATITNLNSPTTTVSNLRIGDNLFTWTITNGTCPPSTATVNIVREALPTVANAGDDQNICTNNTNLDANTPLVGTGTWSTLAAGVTITSPNDPRTSVTGLVAGTTYLFTWTISNGGCPASTDNVQVTVGEAPTAANAGMDQTVCGNSATLAANTPTIGTGVWTVTNGTALITSPTDPTTTVTDLSAGINRFTWTITSDCGTSTSSVTIIREEPPTNVDAGPDQQVCTTTALLDADIPDRGTGIWSTTSSATISDPTDPKSPVSGLTVGNNEFTWTVTNGTCPPVVSSVIITLENSPTAANAGPDQTVCTATTTLSANAPTIGTGTWTVTNGVATITNPSDPNTTVTNLGIGLNTFTWTITNGTCPPSSASVNITREQAPSVADAGTNQTICATSTTLDGNTPTVGTGMWSTTAVGITIVDPMNPQTAVTGLSAGSYTFTWTISNGSCPASTATVQVTVEDAPSIADAGVDQTVCTTSATLSASTPTVGTGVWTVTNGTATVTSPTDPNSTVINLSVGLNTFTWTVTSGTCPPSSASVNITREQGPTIADAGTNQTICTTSTTLDGNAPTIGTGEWSTTAVGVNIVNANDPTTAVTGLSPGTYTFTWTITRGSCQPSTSNVQITVEEAPTASKAGTNQTICETTATIAAKAPIVGTGVWTVTNGTATVTSPTDPNSTVTNLSVGLNTFTWTITNGSCPPSSSSVNITREQPPTVADAGPNQVICEDATSLDGNVPTIGTGMRSTTAVGNTIVDPMNPQTAVTGLTTGSYTFTWTISNGTCTPSTANVQVVVEEAPTMANAGPNQTVCTTSASLDANTPTVGTGIWTTSGTATILSPTDPNTTVTNLGVGVNLFTWTITSGTCGSSAASVSIVREEAPTNVDAGPDQSVCTPTTQLDADIPNVGTGTWSTTSGAVISDPNDPKSPVSALAFGDNTFTWTVTNGTCPAITSTMIVTRLEAPTVADAGTDDATCTGTYTLSANAPTVGTGIWTVTNGTATLTNPSDPNTTVTNLTVGLNTFRWTISNGACPASAASVNITRDELPTVANAGTDQTICTTNTTLSANTPLVGTGTWTLVSGTGVVTNSGDPNSTVTGLGIGNNVFRWTISNGTCAASSAEVNVLVQDNPTVADAGMDQSVCTPNATLNGNTPTVGTGTWTLVSGAGTITNPNSPSSTVTGLSLGVNTFRWTIGNGTCATTTSSVNITLEESPSMAVVGADQTICTDFTNISATAPAIGTGTWTVNTGTGVITSPNSINTSVTNLSYGSNIFTWTVSNACGTSSASLVVIREEEPTASDAGPDQTVCSTTATLSANTPTVGTGSWSVVAGAGIITSPSSPNTSVTSLSVGTNIFRWTISNGTCTDAEGSVAITRVENPTVAEAGDNQALCEATTAVLTGNTAVVGLGRWTQIAGPTTAVIVNESAASTEVQNLSTGEYQFRWTISNDPCPASSDDVFISIFALPNVSNVLTVNDFDFCSDAIPTDIDITVTNTALGVDYELRNGASVLGTQSGNGGSIAFEDIPAPTTTTTYTIFATASTVCPPTALEDEAVVIIRNCNIPVAETIMLEADNCTNITADVLANQDKSLFATTVIQNELTPNGGIINLNPEGIFSYEPRLGFIGVESIEYEVCNDATPQECATGTIMITVGDCINQPPVATTDRFTVKNCNSLLRNVLENDSDPDGNEIYVRAQEATFTSSRGVYSILEDGTIEYTPDFNFVGLDTIRYEVCDRFDGLIPKCTEGEIFITVIGCEEVLIPEGFSPNGDGINDTFVILGAEDLNISLQVFNRWGNVVYESDSYGNDWNGVPNRGPNQSQVLPDGTYYYLVDLRNGEKPRAKFLVIHR